LFLLYFLYQTPAEPEFREEKTETAKDFNSFAIASLFIKKNEKINKINFYFSRFHVKFSCYNSLIK